MARYRRAAGTRHLQKLPAGHIGLPYHLIITWSLTSIVIGYSGTSKRQLNSRLHSVPHLALVN